jgi:hypothetical protein
MFLIVSFTSVLAQNKAYETAENKAVTGNELGIQSQNEIQVDRNTHYPPVVAGQLTFNFAGTGLFSGYDLLSNGTPQGIWQDPMNPANVHGVMVRSDQTAAWSDRTTTYVFSGDEGASWFIVGDVPTPFARAGFPCIDGFPDGRALIGNHNNSNGTTTIAKFYVDDSPGAGTFTELDPGQTPSGDAIWPRVTATGDNSFAFAASINGGTGMWINSYNGSAFTGYVEYAGDQAETHALALSEDGSTTGLLYQGTGDDAGDVFYRESNDGGASYSDPVKVWDWNDVDSLGPIRGLDLVFLDNSPCAVFEIGKQDAIGGSYFPSFPSAIGFWSPGINGGVAKVIADSNQVPYYVQYNSANDVFFPITRPTVGRDSYSDLLFVAFMATTEFFYGDPNGTANTYFGGWFMYSEDNGETFTAPEKFTPDESPMRDWRYISLAPVSSTIEDGSNWVTTVQMNVMADTIPGSTVNNTDPGYPTAVSAELVGVTTQIVRPVVAVDNDVVVNSFELKQNYPNPFNPSTTISYSIAERSNVTIKVYDMLGSEVASLVNTVKDAGSYQVNFNAADLASGLYVYTINAGNFSSSKKMMLMK